MTDWIKNDTRIAAVMSNTSAEHVETLTVNNKRYDVYGYYDADTPDDEHEYYDVFDKKGNCINEGAPFYVRPTISDIEEMERV